MLNKKILITGGAGYIGSHLANHLYKKKNKVFIVDDLSNGSKERLNKNIIFKKICISDEKKISKLLLENNISIIIHLAGKINAYESERKSKEYFKVNYLYSKKLYKTAIKSNVKKFIFASTAAVYGDYKSLFKETDKTIPINVYGSSKLKFEKYIKYDRKINHTILRFFNVTGNHYINNSNFHKNDSVILKLYKTHKKHKRSFQISSNKKKQSTRRDFIHILDLIKIIERIIYDNKKFLMLNCGYGKSLSILEIVNQFEKKFKTKFKKNYKFKKLSDPFEVIADTTKLNKLFNISLKYNSIKKIINKIKFTG